MDGAPKELIRKQVWMHKTTLHFKNWAPNDWFNVILVFQALAKQPGIHHPELHCQEMNSQTSTDVKCYIVSEVINSEQ